jgi:hypothetical protein
MIHFVDKWADAQRACNAIKTKTLLGLDLEIENGATSLLQIAVSTREVYIFDVTALGRPLFDASCLLPILCDPRITKLCYDCRGDAETLFHKHGAKVYGLYDLQIVCTWLFQSPSDPHLKGIAHAARRALPAAKAFAADKARMKRCFRAGENMFARPLSSAALQYCADDAIVLMQMHAALSRRVDAEDVLVVSSIRANRHIFRCGCGSSCSGTNNGMHIVDFP